MGNLEQLIDEIDVRKLNAAINAMDKKSPTYKEDSKAFMEGYIDKVVNLLGNSSIENVIGVLDYYYTVYPSFISLFLKKGNEKILRAQFVIEKIKGYSIEGIKKDPTMVKALEAFTVMGFNTDIKSANNKDIAEGIVDCLVNYLKDKDAEEIDKQAEEDYIKFVKNFDKVEKVMFNGDHTPFYNKFLFVKKLFLMEDADPKLIESVYNIMVNNNAFATFDYKEIFDKNASLIAEVKGLYRKFPVDLIDLEELDTEEEFEELASFLKEICELNKEEEDGLRWFFLGLTENIASNIPLVSYLTEKDFYQFYTSKTFNDMYEEAMVKMKNGDLNIDDNILEGLGAYDKFIDKFDEYFDLVINSDDEHIKKYAVPVLVALIAKQRKENDLDFELTFTRENLDNNTIGYYSSEKNIMYVNQYPLLDSANTKEAFAQAVDTVFHETRHAIQRRDVATKNDFSYDDLVMAVDFCVTELGGGAYYTNNYAHVSYEMDAREVAFVKTMSIFKPYPKMQELYKKSYIEFTNPLLKYMRRNVFLGNESYFGILASFKETVNGLLQDGLYKDDDFYNHIFAILDKYPVLKQFFDIDKNKRKMLYKSKEYFDRKLEQAEAMEDSLEKREIIYSVEAFRYAHSLADYFNDNLWDFDEHKFDYSERITEEAINNVGRPPTR